MEPGLWALPVAMLAAGFASGVHCVGMCGGIVTAFSGARTIPIRDASAPPREGPRLLAFNAGRIAAYGTAGAAAGALGGAGSALAGAVLPAQSALYVLANVMLILIGLHLAGATRLLTRVEALGAPLWRRLRPYAARLSLARSLPQAFAAGLLWGALPCALVYGALAAAAFAGGAAQGALAMLAFGAGTLPNLLAAGLAASRLRAWAARRSVRLAAAALVLGFGVLGLARAEGLAEGLRRGLHLL